MTRWRRRKDAVPARVPGADESLYGPGKGREPYLVRVSRRPARAAMARRTKFLSGTRKTVRWIVVRALEAGAASSVLYGLSLVWVPLAWIVGGLLAGALAVTLSDEG